MTVLLHRTDSRLGIRRRLAARTSGSAIHGSWAVLDSTATIRNGSVSQITRRSSIGETFVVSEAGVEPLRLDADAWPPSYRAGMAAGLPLDAKGRFSLRPPFVRDLAAIVGVMSLDQWHGLASKATTALWTNQLAADVDQQRELADAIELFAPTLEDERRRDWLLLAERLSDSNQQAD